MQRLALLLPEYEIVMEMQGAGPITGPQLMAEIGDERRFTSKGALVAFAGVDASPFQSGTFGSKSGHVSKRGSPHLRRVLFTIYSVILQHSDPENAVFQFMDRKRSEGKHFYGGRRRKVSANLLCKGEGISKYAGFTNWLCHVTSHP